MRENFIRETPSRVKIKGYKKNSCTMIALGNALGISYDLSKKVFQSFIMKSMFGDSILFSKEKLLTKQEFTKQSHVERVCTTLSEDIYYPEEFTTLREYAEENNKGLYLALVRGHLAVVNNGQIIDTWDSGDRIIVSIYKINKEKALNLIKPIAKYYGLLNSEHFNTKRGGITVNFNVIEECYYNHNGEKICELLAEEYDENFTYQKDEEYYLFESDNYSLLISETGTIDLTTIPDKFVLADIVNILVKTKIMLMKLKFDNN